MAPNSNTYNRPYHGDASIDNEEAMIVSCTVSVMRVVDFVRFFSGDRLLLHEEVEEHFGLVARYCIPEETPRFVAKSNVGDGRVAFWIVNQTIN